MSRSRHIAIAVAFGAAGVVSALAGSHWFSGQGGAVATAPHPVWTEMQWPFAIDEWGAGKAFQCGVADCGAEIKVYVRAKLGFCNCMTGVADDDELERLSDFSLVGGSVAALDAGRPIEVGWMKGRSRVYGIADPAQTNRSALSAAFNSDCDAIVATAVFDRRAKIEREVIGFLNGSTVLQWAKVTLGL